ncbi:endonuclease/exonuclease/phosphatase family protein [Tautonia sociabilis]|uniref:Endonuclease/exonuclease/phosphatase domain-containing protein n=1 Tax=Tautonia sociabilis TaxID=2080755 RepID=A0A432MNX3_9BACT|nr:endonuclease/exonuclease/phosphatase family protein [Tautonia sociabilis]RUL88877.1 hypothetical protein TsocGM_04510 [Tautonia sociabilis]
MSQRPIPTELQALIVRLSRRDPRWLLALLAILVALVLLDRSGGPPDLGPSPSPPAEGYLVVSWNVENLFDDTDDPKNSDPLDSWFARDPSALRRKLDLLADALLTLDGGRGPDVLALVEVENRRAVELLRRALNDRLPTEWRYEGVIHRDNISGRRIEPAVITRLPVDDRATEALADRRLLRGRLIVEGEPLELVVGHWTSRVTDAEGSKRLAYARAMYEAYLELERTDPGLADVLLCGDFNDEPDDDSLRIGLRTSGDASAVLSSARSARPRLYNLMAGRDPERFGTYRYRGRWQILDHLVASPGLLDAEGWALVPDSVRTINTPFLRDDRGGPLRFGDQEHANPRGPSDHFAVAVRLRLPSSRSEGAVPQGEARAGDAPTAVAE